jgi:Domain of unknown function DUF1828/Domain of unknown function DUF1829
MSDEIAALVGKYNQWLKDKTALRQVKDWVEITTPYLDRHNDYLQIYVKRENGHYVLTDDGYVIEDLRSSGCQLDTPKRQALFNTTLRGFGVQQKGNELTLQTSADNFAVRKHNLIQAMLAVNDLFYLAEPMVKSLFLEDVAHWLDLHAIRYMPQIKLTGKTGYDYVFDYAIPKSQSRPERLLRAINRPNTDAAKAFVLAWIDTRDARPPDSKSYAFLNDQDFAVSTSVIGALTSYEVVPVVWSQRERVRQELAE